MILDFLRIDEVDLHVLIIADGENRVVQRDAFQCGRFQSPGHDVPWIDLEGARRHTEDRISLRIIPGKIRKRHASMDIRRDFLDRDCPAQHFLLRYGIIEDPGRTEARHLEEEQHDKKNGNEQAEKSGGIERPLPFFLVLLQFPEHRLPSFASS